MTQDAARISATIETKRFAAELKFAGAEVGTFTGYGAVFGNVDSYGDVIRRGAFGDTLKAWKNQTRLPPMLVQHGGWGASDMDGLAIGKWTAMEEDAKGLRVEGKLIGLETERGKIVYAAMKEGVLDGLSIGYSAKEFVLGTKPMEPRRTLKKVDLIEVSVVQMPANDKARIQSIKSGADIQTIREFEAFLRDVGRFPKAAAAKLARGGWPSLDRRDADPEAVETLRKLVSSQNAELESFLRGLSQPGRDARPK